MRNFRILGGLFLGFFLMGCEKDAVQTYRVLKESGPSAAAETAAAPGPRMIEWTLPAGWQEQPPASMRVGSFLIQGENGMPVDVSVIPLGGEAGGDLANINRWRGQINLEPIREADLPQESRIITPGGRRMRLVDFASRDLLIDDRRKKRVIAAIFMQGETAWFFKMTGEDAAVGAAKPSFIKFLESLRFHER